jgi:DNA-directed RNA polymerase specialized sigma24 family protein
VTTCSARRGRAGQDYVTICAPSDTQLSAPASEDRHGFYQEILAVYKDPEVRKLARRRAGDGDLAEDALQEAFCAVAGTADPRRIKDLRAYYCLVLIRSIYALRGQLRATVAEDPGTLAEMHPRWSSVEPVATVRPVEEAAVARLAGQARLERFHAQREDLRKAVPGRSSEPERYRDAILAVAEHLLCEALIGGVVSRADSNESLRSAYPGWFGTPGYAANTCHQHFSRARSDIQDVLKVVISRDELTP